MPGPKNSPPTPRNRTPVLRYPAILRMRLLGSHALIVVGPRRQSSRAQLPQSNRNSQYPGNSKQAPGKYSSHVSQERQIGGGWVEPPLANERGNRLAPSQDSHHIVRRTWSNPRCCLDRLRSAQQVCLGVLVFRRITSADAEVGLTPCYIKDNSRLPPRSSSS